MTLKEVGAIPTLAFEKSKARLGMVRKEPNPQHFGELRILELARQKDLMGRVS